MISKWDNLACLLKGSFDLFVTNNLLSKYKKINTRETNKRQIIPAQFGEMSSWA